MRYKVKGNQKVDKKMLKRIGTMFGSLVVATNMILANGVCTQAAEVKNQTIDVSGKVSEKMALNPRLSATKVTLNVGKTKTLWVKNTFEDVTWYSENEKIVTVSEDGVLKGKKAGKTYVVAEVDGKAMVCKVTVVKKTITKKQAEKMVKKKFSASSGLVFYSDGETFSYKGKKYYVVYVQALVNGDHYSTMTQYLVSTDGKVCKEGYCHDDGIGFY